MSKTYSWWKPFAAYINRAKPAEDAEKVDELNALRCFVSIKQQCDTLCVYLLKSGSCGAIRGEEDWVNRNWSTKQLLNLDRVDVMLWKREVVVAAGITCIEEEGSNCTWPQSSNFHTLSTYRLGNSNHRGPWKNLDIDKTWIDVIRWNEM